MLLFLRTLKSFNRKEKILGIFSLVILLGSVISLFRPSGLGGDSSTNKVYTEGLVGEIIHLNPVYTDFSDADTDISSLIFSGLVKYNAATSEFNEDLASHTLSEDQLTYTFTLKNNIYWHDGVEMTADDLYYTFAEVIQSPDFENPVLQANFSGVKIVQEDSRTISFTLNSSNSFFYTALTVGILPKHVLENTPIAELDMASFNQRPVGSGPYQVESPYEIHDDGSSTVLLTAFPEFYGKIPTIKQIRFVAYQTLEALQENRASWNAAARIRNSILSRMKLTNLVTYQYELPQYTALFFNTDSPFLLRNKERLGLSKAINKEILVKDIGYKVRIDTPLLELMQADWLYAQNLDESQGALFDSGWKLEEGATVRTNSVGTPYSLRLLRRDFSQDNSTQEETMAQTAAIIQEQLAIVGVELTLESYPQEELQEMIQNRDYDLLLYGQSMGYNQDTFAYWHSSQVTEKGLNFSNYKNPNADILIEQIRQSFDPDEKEKLQEELAETIAKDVPAVFLYTPSYYYLVDTRVTGIQFKKLLLPKDRFSNIDQWQIN